METDASSVDSSSSSKTKTWKERLEARKRAKKKDERNEEESKPLLSPLSPLARSVLEDRTSFASSMEQPFKMNMNSFRLDRLGLITDTKGDSVPEVYLVGEVKGGTGFGPCTSCKWKISYGPGWKSLSGAEEGHTQFDAPGGVQHTGGSSIFTFSVILSITFSVAITMMLDSYHPTYLIGLCLLSIFLFAFFLNNANTTIGTPLEKPAVWNHPIDVHLTTSSLEGFPHLEVNVWNLDDHGSASLVAYGFCSIPICSGTYDLSCKTWRPVGTTDEEITRAFINAGPQLKNGNAIFDRFADDRVRLTTVASGTVHIQLSVMLRNIGEETLDSRT